MDELSDQTDKTVQRSQSLPRIAYPLGHDSLIQHSFQHLLYTILKQLMVFLGV